ncbi:glycosyltransferase family 39 protein [Solwaraspora sp. WMMD1047]|uniref:glycosyltransferase family 39 protein n=1 Tax=Solwaraspora sp. WMMD1047 TaxID=3016102 RepID=UPI002417172B|nr:glycosyltransferase family 39 protein [Solwaraspora sp. WMMD1047]MDG4829540.1 glycosyltransferase family 39 protein [Solwaraspora sp. WMMD1047]
MNDKQAPFAPQTRVSPDAPTSLLPRTLAGTVIMPRVSRQPQPDDDSPSEPEASTVRRYPWWQQVLAFLLPAATMFAIGWQGLGDRQLWNDEHATWHTTTLDWAELSRLLDRLDRVVALYYLLMRGWVSLAGDTPTMLRLPSLVAMACAAGLTALLGQRLLGTPAGLVAGLVFTVIPGVSRYAQEARPYAFAVAAAVLATLLLLQALDRPRWPRWLLYAAVVVLAAYFHVVAVLLLVPHALLAWLRYQRSERDVRLWKYLGALAVIAAGVMPLVYAGSGQSQAIDWIEADRKAVVELPMQLFGSYPVAAAVCAVALFGVPLLAALRNRGVTAALVAWALFPPLFTLATAPLLNLFLFRYLLFTLPAWALLAAGALHGISRVVFRRVWPQLVIAAGALPALALLAVPAHQDLRGTRVEGEPDYRAAAEVIMAGVRPGDGIIFAGRARPPRLGMAYQMRDGPRPDDVLLVRSSAEIGDFGVQECPVTLPCLAGRERIWLVSTSYSREPFSEMSEERAATLTRIYQVEQEEIFPRVNVHLLVPRR